MIQLTTPKVLGVGELSCTHLKIHHIDHLIKDKTMTLHCYYGTVDQGEFVYPPGGPGKEYKRSFKIWNEPTPPGEDDGTDYDVILASDPDEDESIYEAAARVLYQFILDHGVSGTIV